MNGETMQFREIVAIIRRHLLSSALIVILCFGLAVGLSYLLPKKFSARAVLNIQAAYFQVPLVGDVISNSNDSSEYKAQRDSLLRYALSNEFLDQLGQKYNLFTFPMGDRLHALERDGLLNRIEYFTVGSNSYQITVSARTGEDAFNLTKDVVDQMISTLISERQGKLIRTRVAIQANLASLKSDMASSGESESSRSSSLDTPESLPEAEAKLSMLEQRFTPNHPSVIQQRKRVNRLRAEAQGIKDRTHESDHPGGLSASHKTLEDLYDDLLRKFNYLNIVIDMEKNVENYPYLSIIERPEVPTAALFPKKPMFAIGGLVLGLVLAFLQAIFMEMRKGTFANPAGAAQVLEAPFLGSLPAWRLLERTTKALPAPPTDPGSHG